MQALLVADDASDREFIAFVLRQAGLTVTSRSDLHTAVEELGETPADLLVISRQSLSEELTSSVRALRSVTDAPVFLLLDRPSDSGIAGLLEGGADLVLSLPVSPRVLTAYCRNHLRRSAGVPSFSLPPIQLASIEVDPSLRTVKVGRRKIQHLTQLEFRLLYTLMTHRGQVIPSDVLVERVWGYAETGSRELVRGLISRLRGKIESDPTRPKFIQTVSGVGYVFEAE